MLILMNMKMKFIILNHLVWLLIKYIHGKCLVTLLIFWSMKDNLAH